MSRFPPSSSCGGRHEFRVPCFATGSTAYAVTGPLAERLSFCTDAVRRGARPPERKEIAMIHPQPTTALLLLAEPARTRKPDSAVPVIKVTRRSWSAALLKRAGGALRWRRPRRRSVEPSVGMPEPVSPAPVRGRPVDGGGRPLAARSGPARRLHHHAACRSKTTPLPGHALRRHP